MPVNWKRVRQHLSFSEALAPRRRVLSNTCSNKCSMFESREYSSISVARLSADALRGIQFLPLKAPGIGPETAPRVARRVNGAEKRSLRSVQLRAPSSVNPLAAKIRFPATRFDSYGIRHWFVSGFSAAVVAVAVSGCACLSGGICYSGGSGWNSSSH
jgi:hypothetical protein